MICGYFQGQEAHALDYYKWLHGYEPDPNARQKIRRMVERLEKVIASAPQPPCRVMTSLQNACHVQVG